MRLASLDIGLKRIGLAITLDGDVVFPQNAIFRRETTQAVDEIKNFLEDWGIHKVIVGVPKGGSSEEVMTKEIERFVKALQKRVDIDVEYQNEYGSSKEAKEMTKGIFRHKKDGKIDSISAKIILERWLYDKN
ncbi:MAG: Holliday junction resolvase RuvX [Epsilonproteobacteria bacterium]|nr:Holliday junction resolvase RuvX [Campylobacterota bacterium]